MYNQSSIKRGKTTCFPAKFQANPVPADHISASMDSLMFI